MNDENNGAIMTEFVRFKAKMYVVRMAKRTLKLSLFVRSLFHDLMRNTHRYKKIMYFFSLVSFD